MKLFNANLKQILDNVHRAGVIGVPYDPNKVILQVTDVFRSYIPKKVYNSDIDPDKATYENGWNQGHNSTIDEIEKKIKS